MKTRKTITYLFRGLVLGTLMIAAIGIYFGATSSGAGDDPSSRGNQVGIAAPSSQTIEASQAESYWIRRDEAEEIAYDELPKNFVGIAYPSSENSQELQAPAYWVQRDEIKHLESQIASLLADAARDPSRNTPQLNREIERLDNEIDMLRLNAMQNQPAGRPKQNMLDRGFDWSE